VTRTALQEALGRWDREGRSDEPIVVAAQSARGADGEVGFVVDGSEEVEVRAGWGIWVPRSDLKSALEQLGVSVPW